MTPRFALYTLLLFVIVIYGFKRYSYYQSWRKWLVWTIVAALFFELLSRVFIYFFHNSMPGYHFLVPAFFIFYSTIYFKTLNFSRFRKVLFLFLTFLGISISIFNSLYIQKTDSFPSNGFLILSLLVITYSLMGFYNMLKNPGLQSPLKEPFFWFISGNLFFYSITFFVFAYFNPLLKKAGSIPDWSYNIIYVSNLGMYLCYLKCLMSGEKQPLINITNGK